MLTLITGTPGAGKSLHTVWEIARHVPGSVVETDQEPVKRVLYSNIKNLLLDHQHIDAADLETWHEWAKPGAVIIFDEVQEVWRPRGMGVKVPDCIAKLETHRHLGVDIVLITQHPMLVDPNIRRLVNQHLHLRRITKTIAMVYEWDHCANPGQTKTCIQSKLWFHPKKAYALYKSAQLHTKPTAKVPKVAILGLLALIGFGVAAPMAYGRLTGSLGGHKAESSQTAKVETAKPGEKLQYEKDGVSYTVQTSSTVTPAAAAIPLPAEKEKVEVAGCIVSVNAPCKCFDSAGKKVQPDPEQCPDVNTKKPVQALALLTDPPRMPLSPAEADALHFSFTEKQRGHTRTE